MALYGNFDSVALDRLRIVLHWNVKQLNTVLRIAMHGMECNTTQRILFGYHMADSHLLRCHGRSS